MATQILIRADSNSAWETEDPILNNREICIDLDSKRFKIGDGSSWTNTEWAGKVRSSGNLDLINEDGTKGDINNIASIDGGGGSIVLNDILNANGNPILAVEHLLASGVF